MLYNVILNKENIYMCVCEERWLPITGYNSIDCQDHQTMSTNLKAYSVGTCNDHELLSNFMACSGQYIYELRSHTRHNKTLIDFVGILH